jgi:hypothetical protein
MSRTVSVTMRDAMFAQESGQVIVTLLTITHPQLSAPFYISSDPTQVVSYTPLIYGTVSRGLTYTFIPFSVILPDDKDESPPAAKLVLDNTARELIPLLRSTGTPATIKLEQVLASAPNAVEISYPELDLVSMDYEAGQITLTLEINALLFEPFPAGTFNPADFPGLF